MRGRRGARLLALTSGGAIPEVADYRVVLDPDETFVGTLNEDFAIESNAGDIFQLGNASWRILQVTTGVVRVADAKGAPPTIPFWLGEAPARSDELSRAVSDLRGLSGRPSRRPRPAASMPTTSRWLMAETGLDDAAAAQLLAYLDDGRRALGAMPTQDTLVLERFFDESGGMQLVLHAPFGSRINKAWGLALRKRFCRQFNFELQAAATEDALLLSLGPQHSFPLADVFRYLHPERPRRTCWSRRSSTRRCSRRAGAGTRPSRWPCRAPRGSRRVAPQLQRMLADDLMAAVFPDAAACLENIPGDRQLPDHPLVNQTVRDCLQEAMDFDGLQARAAAHPSRRAAAASPATRPSRRCSPTTSSTPGRTRFWTTRRSRSGGRTRCRPGARATRSPWTSRRSLDAAAIARVRDEARPGSTRRRRAARRADDVRAPDRRRSWRRSTPAWLRELIAAGRAAVADVPRAPRATARSSVAAERLPELRAPSIPRARRVRRSCAAGIAAGAQRGRAPTAITELVRSRLTIAGPVTAAALGRHARPSGRRCRRRRCSRSKSEGVVLRGRVHAGRSTTRRRVEWCDRALLARIHRYTLNRLRAEIEPVTPGRLHALPLHVAARRRRRARLTGLDGLREVLDTPRRLRAAGRRRGSARCCRRGWIATSRRCSTCSACPARSDGRA